MQRTRYTRRLSSPLLDRFDLRLRITSPAAHDPPGEDSATVALRVRAAAERQRKRFRHTRRRWNRDIPASRLQAEAAMSDEAVDAWHLVMETGLLTGRGAARVRRVARTIADLADHAVINDEHIVLAASLRQDVP